VSNLWSSILSPLFVFAIFRVMTPILYPALGAGISGLSGSLNIALEGVMLVSALMGVIISAYTQSLIIAVVGAIAAGMLLSLVLAFVHLNLKADIVLAGIALNLFASGFTVFLLYITAGSKGNSAALKSLMMPTVNIPVLRDIPVVGQALSGHNILTYVALLAVPFYWFIVNKTPLGLRIRAVGQSPDAAVSTGVMPDMIKLKALLLSGFFASLGGIYLSMGYSSAFGRDMTAGRGFIALAVAVVAQNKPLRTLAYGFLFATMFTFAVYLGSIKFPSELIQTIPYLMTIVVLVIYCLTERKKRRTQKAAEKQAVEKTA
jgi:simple sugar transport system permease protein